MKIGDALPDVFDGIAGTYAQIGDFPEALNFRYKQLEVAEQIGDKQRIANAYNNLSVASEIGDYAQALETLRMNLENAIEIERVGLGAGLPSGSADHRLEPAGR